MTFGEKLQRLRKENRMSQEELASKITVSRQAVSKWELNEAMPDIDNIKQLSKIFGISMDYLLDDEINIADEIPSVKETTKKIKNKYNKFWFIAIVTAAILALIIGNALNIQGTIILGIICLVILTILALIIRLLALIIRYFSNKKII